jgi:ankyrin repeat protein
MTYMAKILFFAISLLLTVSSAAMNKEFKNPQAICWALISNPESLQKLLDNGFSFCHMLDGRSPLMIAAENNQPNNVKILLKAKTNLFINGDSNENYSFIYSFRHNADIFAKDERNGDTPLIIAVRKGHLEVAQAILEHARSAPDLLSLTSKGFVDTFTNYPEFKGKDKIKRRILVFLLCIKELKKHNISLGKFIIFETIKLTYAESINISRLLTEENNKGYEALDYCSHNNKTMRDLLQEYKNTCNIKEEKFYKRFYDSARTIILKCFRRKFNN